MTASVVRDDAKAMACQKVHLAIPGVRVEGPAVGERHDRAVAPILVVDLRAVRGGEGVSGHGEAP
ncbi:hypothetical protein D3C81_1932450 [compost metagenome]